MLLTYIEHLVSFPDHHMDHRHSYGVESKNPAWVWSFQIPCSMSMACLKFKKKIREINEINILPFLNQKPSLRFTLASGAALITGYKWLVGKRPINLTALVGPHSPEIEKKIEINLHK